LDSALVKKHPDLMAEIWEGDFKADFAKSEYGPVVDVKRHSEINKHVLLTFFCSGWLTSTGSGVLGRMKMVTGHIISPALSSVVCA
jgi:hypothetical protein